MSQSFRVKSLPDDLQQKLMQLIHIEIKSFRRVRGKPMVDTSGSFSLSLLKCECECRCADRRDCRCKCKGECKCKCDCVSVRSPRYIDIPLYFSRKFAKGEDLTPRRYKYPETPGYTMKGKHRDHQFSILEESLRFLRKKKTTLIAAFPGAGKTYMGAVLGSSVDGNSIISSNLPPMKVVIIVHQKTLAAQWVATFQKHTDAKINYFKATKKEMPNNESLDDADVSIVMIERVKELTREKKYRSHFGMMIVDEAHNFYAKGRSKKLLQLHPKYLIYLTATPNKKNGSDMVTTLMIGNHRVVRKIDKSFIINGISTSIVPELVENSQGVTDFTKLYQSLLYNENRNRYIQHLVIRNKNFKILILTKERDHAKILSEMFDEVGIKYSTMFGKQNKYKDRNVLIGTVSKIGTGFDEESFAEKYKGKRLDLLIMTITYSDENMYEQTIGRVLRSQNPKVIFLKDESGINDNHWRKLKKWAKENKGTTSLTSLDLDDQDTIDQMEKIKESYVSKKGKRRTVIDNKEPVIM